MFSSSIIFIIIHNKSFICLDFHLFPRSEGSSFFVPEGGRQAAAGILPPVPLRLRRTVLSAVWDHRLTGSTCGDSRLSVGSLLPCQCQAVLTFQTSSCISVSGRFSSPHCFCVCGLPVAFFLFHVPLSIVLCSLVMTVFSVQLGVINPFHGLRGWPSLGGAQGH